MIVALRMRVVATGEHYVMMSDSYASETLAISAVLKDHPECAVARVSFPSRSEYAAFVAFARDREKAALNA
jgi:hypothetical protein